MVCKLNNLGRFSLTILTEVHPNSFVSNFLGSLYSNCGSWA